jgi:NAD(P)-dependent dehydrogenase (short-subunit alcohol dehydrogenase family)
MTNDLHFLTGRPVIITGACRGLGLAMAEAVLAAGGQVTATSVDAAALVKTCQRLADQYGGENILGVAGDVAREADCERVVAETLGRFGGLYGLVNNAGLGMSYVNQGRPNSIPFWKTDTARWLRVIEVNLMGTFLMTKAATPHLVARKAGRIVNITTSLAHMHNAFVTPYGPSKGAIEAMALAWAKELNGTGVTVNTLAPGGATDTLMVSESYRSTGQPLLDPDIMQAPILWLLSDRSAMRTGCRYVAKNWASPGADARAFEEPVYRQP